MKCNSYIIATYKTSKDIPDELKKALPNIEDLKKLLDDNDLYMKDDNDGE